MVLAFGMEHYLYSNYTPVGDILVVTACLLFLVLMHIAYITKTRTYTIFRLLIFTLILAATCSLCFHMFLSKSNQYSETLICLMRAGYHSFLYVDMFLYVVYIREQMHLGRRTTYQIVVPAGIGTLALIIYEFLSAFFHWDFQIQGDDQALEKMNLFPFGYVAIALVIMYLLIRYRKRLYKQVMTGVFGASVLAFVVLFVQEKFDQTSFTVGTYLLPAFAVLYMMHSNPYNLEMGAVDASAFDDLVKYSYKKKKDLLMMTLLLVNLEEEGTSYPQKIKETIRKFAVDYFRGATLFQVSNGRQILVADKEKNPDYENIINKILNGFDEEYPRYRMPFKIMIIHSHESISRDRDYMGLIRYVESKMSNNDVRYVSEEDISEYEKHKYILSELINICKTGNLDDERVHVYCQPVLNIATQEYDTAEALMRIVLPEVGMIYPDVFIPLAEENGIIHQLSLMILHKTCEQIRIMLEQGYHIVRISVNISAQELRDDCFCLDIGSVIRKSGIPFGKVAIELTESQSEGDFMIMKSKIEELRESGIKFYLDDFGTGYSNFERIMELPFDIIKFDRSMVQASAVDQKSESMVSHLAHLFSDMDYSVLYEGVETTDDESRCRKMDAKYLQGYKYSKPIPIERLTEYFKKEA